MKLTIVVFLVTLLLVLFTLTITNKPTPAFHNQQTPQATEGITVDHLDTSDFYITRFIDHQYNIICYLNKLGGMSCLKLDK